VPVTLVCEEAHRYVPVNSALGFEPCKRAIAKIAKEGRKYGASLCIVTQRPAEIDPTILSQCNTVFALRMSNERDQAIVASAVADTGSGLLEFLPSLGEREAIAFGDGLPLPVRIKFDELPKSALPRSSTARFSERWQKSLGDEGFLDQIVERWRASAIPTEADPSQNASMMASALGIRESSALDEAVREALAHRRIGQEQPPSAPVENLRPIAPGRGREASAPAPAGYQPVRDAAQGLSRGEKSPPSPPEPERSSSLSATEANSLRSLRERLLRSN
jgi:DNA segregation ATPase FtsK/SpoIIIE-like protein